MADALHNVMFVCLTNEKENTNTGPKMKCSACGFAIEINGKNNIHGCHEWWFNLHNVALDNYTLALQISVSMDKSGIRNSRSRLCHGYQRKEEQG